MTLAVVSLVDPAAIDGILKHTALASKLQHDGREPGFIDHPLVSYHGAYVHGVVVGVFTSVAFSRWETEVHAAILPCALPFARDLGRLFLAEVFAAPDVMRATGYVLGTLPSAANYCRRLGLRDEGRRREACRIDGEPVDVIVLGLTRTEWLASSAE